VNHSVIAVCCSWTCASTVAVFVALIRSGVCAVATTPPWAALTLSLQIKLSIPDALNTIPWTPTSTPITTRVTLIPITRYELMPTALSCPSDLTNTPPILVMRCVLHTVVTLLRRRSITPVTLRITLPNIRRAIRPSPLQITDSNPLVILRRVFGTEVAVSCLRAMAAVATVVALPIVR
jgi:hypothetical protein